MDVILRSRVSSFDSLFYNPRPKKRSGDSACRGSVIGGATRSRVASPSVVRISRGPRVLTRCTVDHRGGSENCQPSESRPMRPIRWGDVERRRDRDMGREATQCTSRGEVSMRIGPANRSTAAPGARYGYPWRSTGYLQWAEGRAFATVRDETQR